MGGEVMNDQASITYSGSISQMSYGHTWLLDNIKVQPDEGFALDPFGESSTQVLIYSQIGFHNNIINRISMDVKNFYKEQTVQMMEFFWKPFKEREDKLLTHLLYDHYNPPNGYRFWRKDSSNPKITDKNVAERSLNLISILNERAKSFKTDIMFLPFGDDFAFTDPDYIYENMNKIISWVNKNESTGYKFQYSLVSEFFDDLRVQNVDFPELIDQSFFVYDDNENSYWSGYFVSQPRLKIYSRLGERIARVAEFLYSLSMIYETIEIDLLNDLFPSIELLRDKNAQLLHHDAITGTEKFFVSDFYIDEMDSAFVKSKYVMETALSSFVSNKLFGEKENFLNYSLESFTKMNEEISFIFFNSLGWKRSENTKVSFFSMEENFDVEIKDHNGNIIPSECVECESGNPEKKVLVKLDNIEPLSYNFYTAKVVEKKDTVTTKTEVDLEMIENDFYQIFFDANGKINRVLNKKTNINVTFKLDFSYYESFSSYHEQNSGAYIFRVKDDGTKSIMISEKASLEKIVETELSTDVYQTYGKYISIRIRLMKQQDSANFFEVFFTKLGEIPVGHEVIITVDTDINNEQVFYHDELALEMKQRKFDEKEHKVIPGNHMPMQYTAYMKDKDNKVQVTVMSTKSQSVSSTRNGQLEMMIHRSCPRDDSRGVGEALKDTYIINENDNFALRFTVDTPENSVKNQIYDSYILNYPLEVFYVQKDERPQDKDDFKPSLSFMKNELEKGKIHLLSLDRVNMNSEKDIALRINNVNLEEQTEPIEVNVEKILEKSITKSTEMYLSLLREKESSEDMNSVKLDKFDFRTYKVNF